MTGHNREGRVNDVYSVLLTRAKAEADRKSLTISDLAVSSSITENRLNDIFEGRAREITLRELTGLSIALDIPVADLLSPY